MRRARWRVAPRSVALAAAAAATTTTPSAPRARRRRTTRDEVVGRVGAEGGFDAQKIYKDEAPGVVTIAVAVRRREGGEGSGFVLNDEGEIVTNAHVVTTGEGGAIKRAARGLRRVRGRQPRAARRCSGTTRTPTSRCCAWRPKGLDAAAAAAGRQRAGRGGEPVAAIGSPFGQAQSLSVGIVSAVDRSVASLTEFAISGAIQTDAAINPGNSGGPLVGADGRVIGVNQQIQSRSGGGEGVGFAVPIDVVKRSVGQLREEGRARYAYLGVSSVPLYPQLVEHFELRVDEGRVGAGGRRRAGRPRTPACAAAAAARSSRARAFARGGDVITKVGDTADQGRRRPLERDRPLQARRDRRRRDPPRRRDRDVKVKLGERPAATG